MKATSKPKSSATPKVDVARLPSRPSVDLLMAMSDEDFRTWIRHIGLEAKVQRALRELDGAV